MILLWELAWKQATAIHENEADAFRDEEEDLVTQTTHSGARPPPITCEGCRTSQALQMQW